MGARPFWDNSWKQEPINGEQIFNNFEASFNFQIENDFVRV